MNEQDTKTELVEAPRKPMGRVRIKPRHLSRVVRQTIIDQFQVRQSSEDVTDVDNDKVGALEREIICEVA